MICDMKKTIYQTPHVRVISLDLENFICTSIQTMTMYTEVDEYGNIEHELYLD